MYRNALLTIEEMGKADRMAMESGVSGLALMEAAGGAVAREIRMRYDFRHPIVILCGPGNNGGDGFVAARILKKQKWPVRVALLGELADLKGDAAVNAKRWVEDEGGDVEPLGIDNLDGVHVVVDALFGAGLSRSVQGVAAEVIDEINERQLDCIAVDIPSGVHGDTGEVMGTAPECVATVTFFRGKPGHHLTPGRDYCGALDVADISIPATVLFDIEPQTFVNGPGIWLPSFPWPDLEAHKYARGHGVVLGGAEMTGAARLAARAARRVGAGLATIAAPSSVVPIYAMGDPGTLVKAVDGADAFAAFLEDDRRNAVLMGPGAGVTADTRDTVLGALAAETDIRVLDADALSVFQDNPKALMDAVQAGGGGEKTVMTPHDGEYKRIFTWEGDRLSRARAAAAESGAVVLLKGPDTVIARPDGVAVINADAPPTLATAGSGDVLAGLVMGLGAQGMSPFDAACAAAWLHGQAAENVGLGLIAEDLADQLPDVLDDLVEFLE